MTTPTARRPSKDARGTVPRDAPIRQYRKVTLSRDEWDALKSGQTVEQVRRGRTRILASDARVEGE